MTGENFEVRASLIAKDEASPAFRAATESLAAFERQVKALGAIMGKGMGAELARSFESVITNAKALGSTMADGAEKGTRALNSETVAARELRDALREVASAQDAVTRGAGRGAGGVSASRGTSGAGNANGRPGGTAGAGGDLRDVRARWRIREASLAAEHRDAERERRAQASAAAAQVRARDDAFNQRLRQQRYLIGVRERSEAAELRHVAGIRRENEMMRRRAASAGQHAYRHGRHAVASVNHPVFQSPGFWLHAGAAFGVEAGRKILEGTIELDTAATRYRMLAVPDGANAAALTEQARMQSLKDSISLGVDAGKVLDMQTKAIRDGVSPEIAKTLPAGIAAAAQVMGGDVEKLTDSLAEGLQEGFAMKWLKTPEDARKFLNIEAGLSNYAGNSAAKTEQFIAAGGLGHGKEMGLGLVDTMAYGAMLNASGARTGQASARFMGQLSQNVPKLFDYYRSAVQSRKNTEEDRAVRAAPRALGYGGIRDMQSKIMAGPEGLIDFATRLDRLDEKARKLTLQGLHFSEQGGAMLAELGANEGTKGKAIVARAKELASQKAANDYLSAKFKEWSTGLAFMFQQIEAGYKAIETEIGDVLKVDLVTPFRDWWVELSKAIVGGNLRDRVHNALLGFVHGLGFEDVAALLSTLSSNVGGFDLAGFAQGLGEGIRATVDSFRSMAGIFGGAGGLDARTVGRLAAEMFGLSVGLHAVAPVMTTIGGIASSFLALKAALEGVGWVARLAGITEALGVGGATIAEGAAGAGALGTIAAALTGEGAIALAVGALPITIATVLAGTVLAVTIANWSAIREFFTGPGGANDAKADLGPNAQVKDWRLKSVPESMRNDPTIWSKFLSPAEMQALQFGPNLPEPGMVDRVKGLFHRSSYEGGEDPNNWRNLMTPAAYVTDDASAGDRDRDTAAMLGTSRAAQRIADNLDGLVPRLSTLGSTPTAGEGGTGGSGGGSGAPNLRYGRRGGGSSGAYRGTPVPDAPYNGKSIDGLSEGATKQFAAILGKRESGNRYDTTNRLGFVGRWQMGAAALAENGYVKAGTSNAGLRNPSAWTGKGGVTSLGDFLANKNGVQDTEFGEYTNRHVAQLRAAGVIRDGMSQADIAGWLAAAHLKGVGGAIALSKGHDNADANGTTASSYRRMMAGVGSEAAASPTSASSLVPNVRGAVGNAVDIAGKLNGMSSAQAAKSLGSKMTSGQWCADLVNGALKAAGLQGSGSSRALSFQNWGHRVGVADAQKGDVIVENHGGGHGHVGLATGAVQRDAAGNVVAIGMTSGNHGNKVVKDYWEKVGAIEQLRRTDEVRKQVSPPTPEGLATAAKAGPKGSAPPEHHAPVHHPMVTASAAPVTIHAPIHVNGAADPHHIARVVGDHLATLQRRQFTDAMV